MPSNFEEQKKIVMGEYVCAVCCRWFLDSGTDKEINKEFPDQFFASIRGRNDLRREKIQKLVKECLICPHCGKVAMINDEIEL